MGRKTPGRVFVLCALFLTSNYSSAQDLEIYNYLPVDEYNVVSNSLKASASVDFRYINQSCKSLMFLDQMTKYLGTSRKINDFSGRNSYAAWRKSVQDLNLRCLNYVSYFKYKYKTATYLQYLNMNAAISRLRNVINQKENQYSAQEQALISTVQAGNPSCADDEEAICGRCVLQNLTLRLDRLGSEGGLFPFEAVLALDQFEQSVEAGDSPQILGSSVGSEFGYKGSEQFYANYQCLHYRESKFYSILSSN